MHRSRPAWFGVLLLATIVATLGQPRPAAAECYGYESRAVCYQTSNFGPGEADSSSIYAAPGGVIYYGVGLQNSTALGVGFRTTGSGRPGAWLEVFGR